MTSVDPILTVVSHDEEAAVSAGPPDGGLQAWLCVGAGFLGQFCSFGFLNAYVHFWF
jgi:hypothetical protein